MARSAWVGASKLGSRSGAADAARGSLRQYDSKSDGEESGRVQGDDNHEVQWKEDLDQVPKMH